MKEYMVRRYSTDTLFQRRMKEYMVKRYAGDSEFKSTSHIAMYPSERHRNVSVMLHINVLQSFAMRTHDQKEV